MTSIYEQCNQQAELIHKHHYAIEASRTLRHGVYNPWVGKLEHDTFLCWERASKHWFERRALWKDSTVEQAGDKIKEVETGKQWWETRAFPLGDSTSTERAVIHELYTKSPNRRHFEAPTQAREAQAWRITAWYKDHVIVRELFEEMALEVRA